MGLLGAGAGGGSVDLGSAHGKIEVDYSQVGQQFQSTIGNIEQTISGRMQNIGGKMQSFGQKFSLLTAPITGFVAAGALAFANFDDILTEIEARTGATAAEMEIVRKTALDMGRDTAFSATQASDAMLQLLSSGSSLNETLMMLPDVLNLAAAGALDLGFAADAVTDIMAQFQLEADKTVMVTDALARASGASSATITDLIQGFANVGPIANSFGISVEETAATLAVFAENGIKGAEAGTQLKSMLTNMSRQTDDVQGMWKQLGVSMFDAQGNMRDINDIIVDLNKAMEGMTDQERINVIQTLAGSYGQIGLSALLAEGGISDMQESMAEQADAATLAEARMNSFKGVINQLRSTIETLMLNVLGPMLDKYVKPLIKDVTTLINKVNAWAQANPELATKLGLVLVVLALIGPLVFGLGGAVSLLGAALGALLSPIGLVVAALAALFLAYELNFLGIKDALKPIFDLVPSFLEIEAMVRSLIYQLQTFGAEFVFLTYLTIFQERVPKILDKISKAVMTKGRELINKGIEFTRELINWLARTSLALAITLVEWSTAFIRWIDPLVAEALPKLGIWLGQIIEWVIGTGIPELIKAGIGLTGAILQWIVDAAPELVPKLLVYYATLLNFLFNTLLPGVIEAWREIGKGFIRGLKTAWDENSPAFFAGLAAAWNYFFTTILPFIIAHAMILAGAIVTWFKSKWDEVKGDIPLKLAEFITWLADLGVDIQEEAPNLVVQLITAAKNKWDEISPELAAKFDEIKTWLGNLAVGALVHGAAIITALISAAKVAWDLLIQGLWDKFAMVGTELIGLASDATTWATDIGTNIVDGIKAGINNQWDSFTSFLSGKADSIKNSFASKLGIQSPSRVFEGFGQNLMDGLKNGISSRVNSVTSLMSSLATNVANIVAGIQAKVGLASTAINSLKNLMNSSNNLGSVAGGMVGGAHGANTFNAPVNINLTTNDPNPHFVGQVAGNAASGAILRGARSFGVVG
jgi:TP901 family phage tail tape measure protein